MPEAFPVSAVNGQGLDELIAHIAGLLRERERLFYYFVPFSEYALLSDLRRQGRLVSEEHREEGTLVSVMLDHAALGRLQAKYGGRLDMMARVSTEEE